MNGNHYFKRKWKQRGTEGRTSSERETCTQAHPWWPWIWTFTRKYFLVVLESKEFLNPLSPSIHKQILQSDLHTFPLRISWENLIKHQDVFSFVIIFYILTTLSLDNVWRLLGENCCWSLLGLKGLMERLRVTFTANGKRHFQVENLSE